MIRICRQKHYDEIKGSKDALLKTDVCFETVCNYKSFMPNNTMFTKI